MITGFGDTNISDDDYRKQFADANPGVLEPRVTNFLVFSCKVCRKPGMVEYEMVEGREFSEWISILVHTRCSDFMAAKIKEERAMNSILAWYQRKLKEDDDEANMEAKEKARVALVRSTKVFCRCVCAFYRKPFAWEPSMPDGMLNEPERFKWFLSSFEYAQSKAVFA